MTPIIRKFVLKLLSKDRGSGITSIPGGQHRMIQESIITDTLLKKGVNPESITSEGMLQSILNGIKKEEAMIARSKADAQKQLATVMDMKGRKIKPGSKIMGGEEVVETEAEIAERLNKGNKEGIERIKEKQLIESFDPDEMASGGRAGFKDGLLAKLMGGVKPDGGVLNSILKNKYHPIISSLNTMELYDMLNMIPFAKGGRAGYFIGGKVGAGILKLLKDKKKIKEAYDNIFPTGDYKYDADMVAESLVENNPKVFGGRLYEDLTDVERSAVYGAGLEEASTNFAKALQLKRAMRKASKPTKTLEGIENTGTINISDPDIAEEFARFMKETDPEGSKVIEQTVELSNFNPKGRKKNATGGRAGFAGGGMGRRAFLKLMAALGATGVAAKSGLVSLLGKGGGKQVAKELTQVPIKQINEMPAWFKPLVNKVIKEGTEVDSGAERVITHKTKLPNSKTEVYVNQDLNNGDVWVDLGVEKHGFADGKFGQPVRLEYKAAEEIPVKGKKGSIKTKEEFNVEEAEFTGGHPENVKFEESTINKFGKHESNFDEVEAFATGKTKKGARNVSESFDKMNEDIADRFSNYPDPNDYADGGRVPMWMGGGLSKGKRTLAELLKMMSKDSSHGKTPSEMLQMINPKQFNQMLDRPEGIPSIAKEMIEKYTTEMKGDRVNMIQDLIATGRRIKKVDDDLVNYKIKIVEDMVSKGVDRGTAKEMAETLAEMVSQGAGKRATPKITDEGLLEMENIQKNLATKDRKLNASGGIARMLGE